MTTPNGRAGGIWQGGDGLAADKDGNIFLLTGEGSYDLNAKGKDSGDSVLKLNPGHGLHVVDYFTPFNQLCMDWYNMDLGSAGPLLLPSSNELIAGGKEGRIYVLNRSHLGGYNTLPAPCDNTSLTTADRVMQELPPDTVKGGIWGAMAYWNGPDGQYIYVSGGQGNRIEAFKLTNGQLSSDPSSQSPLETDKNGKPVVVAGNPVVSSNGTRKGTGIVWLIDLKGILRAYDADNLAHELYASNQNADRDQLGEAIKFSVPTVVHGEMFVGTTDSLVIYGMLQ
jgi:hypothetical protein